MDLIVSAENTIKNALNKGCDEAEVFIKTAKRFSVETKNNSVDVLETGRDFGISLRVIKKKRLGFSFTTGLDEIEGMIDEAVKGADYTAEDEYIDIPDYRPASDFGELSRTEVLVFDEKLKNIKEDDIIENALLLEKTALHFDDKIKKVRKAGSIIRVGSTVILNSKGVNVSYESSHITAYVTVLASDGKDSQTGWDFATSRRLSDIDFIAIAENASRKAVALLGAKKVSNVKVPVILDSSVAKDFLSIFSASLSAEAVQKKRSFLIGRAGRKIMSPIVNIIDDGLMPWKIGTKPVDDEGVPTSRKVIVSKGVLAGFIHNTYTARKDGTTSTGNAVRRGFRSLPEIGVTNLYIEPDKSQGLGVRGRGSETARWKENNLITSISKGILILETMGMHTANPVSGDFSVGISGFWIENRGIAYPIKEAVMSGNILELFNKVGDIGDDLRFYGKVGSPSLLIGEVDISA